MFRKKSKYDVAREQLEETLHELISQGFEQGDQLRQTIAERAPEVRDRLAEEVPEMVDKLPAPVADYLPESAKSKPKRKRSRVKKLLFVGLVIGGAAAAAAVLNNRNSGGSYEFDAPPVPRTAPTTSTSQDSSAPTAPSSQNASTQTGSDAGQAPGGDSPA